MSEEEIIKEIKEYLDCKGSVSVKTIEGLLDLYNKEKEKNKELELENIKLREEKGDIVNTACETSKEYIKKDQVERIRFNFNRFVDKILEEK